MSTLDDATSSLITAMDLVLNAMKRMTPSDLTELLSVRLKSKIALAAFLKALEERCATLRARGSADLNDCKSLDERVAALGPLVHAHITKWNPAAISADVGGYRDAVGRMQHEIRWIIIQSQRLAR